MTPKKFTLVFDDAPEFAYPGLLKKKRDAFERVLVRLGVKPQQGRVVSFHLRDKKSKKTGWIIRLNWKRS